MKIEDLAFWAFLVMTLAIILWLLHGSPLLENALISIGTLILSTEFILWRKYHQLDTKAAVSFTRFKSDLNHITDIIHDVKQRQERIEQKVDTLLERIRK